MLLDLSNLCYTFILVLQVQLTTVAAPAAPVGSMGTQTIRDDAVSKAMEEQTTPGSAVTVSTPSQATPMETQEIGDVDGKELQAVHFCDGCDFIFIVIFV
jgi:hypothetical protein